MTVAVQAAGRVAQGATRTASGATRSGAGRAGAKHAAKPGRAVGKPGGAKHAAAGQGGRDARQAADMGLAYSAGRGRRRGRSSGSSGSSSWSPTRALIAEFALCTVILALSPLSAPEGKTNPADWMKRGSALCAVFMLLGMAASIGPKAGRAAVALGGLITVVLLIDQRSIFGVLSSSVKPIGAAVGDGLEAGADVVAPPAGPTGEGEAIPRKRRYA